MTKRWMLSFAGCFAMIAALGGCPEEEEGPTTPGNRGTLDVTVVDTDGAETNSLLADGRDYVVIEIVAKNPEQGAWVGDVDLNTDLGSFGGPAPSAQAEVATDSNGEAQIQFACIDPATGDPSAAGQASVLVRNVHATVRLTINCQAFEPAYDVELEGPSGTSFHADGYTEVPLTATVTGRYGDPEEDAIVVFETVDGSARLCSPSLSPCETAMLVSSLSLSSDAAGHALVHLKALSEPGVVQVQASWTYDVAENPLTDMATIPFALDRSSIELESSRRSIPATGSGTVDLVATVIAPDGDPMADGSFITFRVSGGPYTLGTPAAATQQVAISGGAGQAMVALNGSTTLGVASVTAEYRAPSGQTMRTAPVLIEFVQPGQLLLTLDAEPQEIWTDDQEYSTVSIVVERDGAPVSGQQIRFFLTESDAALATFGAQGSSPSIRDAQRVTSASGEAALEVRGFFAGAAGSVVVHATTQDAQNGNALVESTIFVLLKRHPLLQSVVFLGADPEILGTQGSPRPSTAIVTFQAIDDNSNPMEGIEFRFLRPITIDPMVSITTVGGGDTTYSSSEGMVIAYLSAGVQAHPVRVIAEATDPRTGFTLTVTSDPIPITSGLASFTHSWFVCDHDKATLEPPADRSCSAVLADRFSERVPEGHSVQFRVESGNITPASTTGADGSAADVSYLTGAPAPADTPDTAGAMGTANPTDQLVAMLAYTRGEEPFTDINGNGVYDPGEPFVDFPEPFVDKNDNCDYDLSTSLDPYVVLRQSDIFVDGNNNGTWDMGNNTWDDDTLIWFQEWTLYVRDFASFQVVDVECAGGGAAQRCNPQSDHQNDIRWIDPGEVITLRFRAVDVYGNCPAPGLDGQYAWEAENAENSGTSGADCGLYTGYLSTAAGTGYLQPYCVIHDNLELNPNMTIASEGVGSHPLEVWFDTSASVTGVAIKITLSFEGGGSTEKRTLIYVIPCETDADCGATLSDPNDPTSWSGPKCDTAKGFCLAG